MKITIAIDSFKGSLSTTEAGEAVGEGFSRIFPDAEICVSPLADGGEGTLDAIISARNGRIKTVSVSDPLGRKISAEYGIIDADGTAIIEMARAAGLTLIPESERNPLYTTTFGVGELILDAIGEGCRSFVIGIGGSATNDGGAGMLKALGVKFLDSCGLEIENGAIGLKDLAKILLDGMPRELSDCKFSVACDVKNPLCGENGASAVYGPQKGADEKTVKEMDSYLARYAELTKQILPLSDACAKGAGAAGGLGFAFMSYLGATLSSGIDIVIKETDLERHVKGSSLVITGEGRIDSQSAMGKAPTGVARLAKKYGIPTIAIGGGVKDDATLCHEHGIDAIFPAVRTPISLEAAMEKSTAKKNLTSTAEEIARLIAAFKK